MYTSLHIGLAEASGVESSGEVLATSPLRLSVTSFTALCCLWSLEADALNPAPDRHGLSRPLRCVVHTGHSVPSACIGEWICMYGGSSSVWIFMWLTDAFTGCTRTLYSICITSCINAWERLRCIPICAVVWVEIISNRQEGKCNKPYHHFTVHHFRFSLFSRCERKREITLRLILQQHTNRKHWHVHVLSAYPAHNVCMLKHVNATRISSLCVCHLDFPNGLEGKRSESRLTTQ